MSKVFFYLYYILIDLNKKNSFSCPMTYISELGWVFTGRFWNSGEQTEKCSKTEISQFNRHNLTHANPSYSYAFSLADKNCLFTQC